MIVAETKQLNNDDDIKQSEKLDPYLIKSNENLTQQQTEASFPDEVKSINIENDTNGNAKQSDHIIPHDAYSNQDINFQLSTILSQNTDTSINNEKDLSENLKFRIGCFVRNSVFRRIKFLTDDHLGSNGYVFQQIYNVCEIKDQDQMIKNYKIIKNITKRQLNTKRNYSTERIMTTIKSKCYILFMYIKHLYILKSVF
jgi:hypothetical protein